MQHPSRDGVSQAPYMCRRLPLRGSRPTSNRTSSRRPSDRCSDLRRHMGYELRLVGATVLSRRQVIARSRSRTWLFVGHVEDPTGQQRKGKILVPAIATADLLVPRHGVNVADRRPATAGQFLTRAWLHGRS
jgi:hypothetical protein